MGQEDRPLSRIVQTALDLVFPPLCLGCEAQVETAGGFCGPCFREVHFIAGAACDACGTPLPAGETGAPDTGLLCDDCLRVARPWDRGRAALVYAGTGRRMVLGLKHADRADIARPAARWMARAAGDLVLPGMVVAPVPLHWRRMLKRRYNQAALLSAAVARTLGLPHCPDLLTRTRATAPLEGVDRAGRFDRLAGTIAITPRHGGRIAGRPVMIVDDVMTSGATLAAAAEAAQAAGAGPIRVLLLARVAKDT